MHNSTIHYLHSVKELEATIFTQNQLLGYLKSQSASLGNPKKHNPPTLRTADDYNKSNSGFDFFIRIIVLVVCLCTWLFIPPFSTIVAFLRNKGGNLGAIVGLGGTFLFWLIYAVIASKKRLAKAQMRAEEYNKQAMKKFSDIKMADHLRTQKELCVKEQLLEQIRLIEQQKQEIKQNLDQLYALNVIHPKYRNLIAIASFCEYFETERCTALTGHEGAYNVYEQEARMNLVLTKLDVVISRLDEIKNNQYTLYQVLTEANNTLFKIDAANSRMINSLNAIQENTALTEYNSRVAAISTRATGEFLVLKELLSSK